MKMKLKCVVLLLVPAILLTGCSGGASTPEAAFEGFKKGMLAKDYSSAFTYVTEESQTTMLQGMILVSSFATFTSEEKGKELEAIFDKHGLDTEDKSEAPLAKVKDKGALFGDLLTFIESANPGGQPEPMTDKLKEGKLTDVKITGETAAGKFQDEPMHFAKVDGNWKLDFKATMEADGMPSMDEMPSPGDFTIPGGPDSENSDPFESSNPFEGDTAKPTENSETPQPE